MAIRHRLLGGILLIAGTTIGAGILALPIATGLFGFYPSVFLFTGCFLLMLWTAFIILEVNLKVGKQSNLISMANATLGKGGEWVTWGVYLCLFYALLCAYMSGSGQIVNGITQNMGTDIPSWLHPLLILVLFAPFIYFGLDAVDKLNRILMIGLLASFVVLICLLFSRVEATHLAHQDMAFSLTSLSVIFTAFGYHVIIPTLTEYLNRDTKALKICIFFGSLIPFVTYLVWQFIILGSLPVSGEFGIADSLKNDYNISYSLSSLLGNPTITVAISAFSVFAIVTSFLGVAQGLFDFLRDGLKLQNGHSGKLVAFVLTFLPPLIFTWTFKNGFILALEYSGALVAVLLGILPVLMISKLQKRFTVFRCVALVFFTAMIVLVFAKNFGLLAVPLEKYLS